MNVLPLGTGLFSDPVQSKQLREHQVRAVEMLRKSLRSGNRRVVIQMPTGAGKTRTAAEIVKGALAKGNRVAFTVPYTVLINQTVAAFASEGIDGIGVMQASHVLTDPSQPVQIVSLQTMASRGCPDVDMVIVDEAHRHFAAVREWIAGEPGKVFVGLTATPWARGMAEDWQELLIPVGMQDLIDREILSPFRVFAPTHPDMSGVKIRNGDYAEEGSADVMGGLVADVVSTWLDKARGLPTLVFAVNLAHAEQIQAQFAAAGVQMGYCEARTDPMERRFLFQAMARGELAGIVNVGTLTTGVDADVRCVVLARPTRSEMLFVQMIGRGLRTAPGKDHCLILDHADNHARLGFVTDIHHNRLLSGKDKRAETRKDKGEPMPKECGSCGVLKPPKVHICPACGFEPVRQANVEVEDGELIEISRGSFKPKPFSKADKQRFWSMARFVDRQRNKGGRLAKALYRAKFGVWPQGLSDLPMEPDMAFLSYERSRRIAYAKGKGVAR